MGKLKTSNAGFNGKSRGSILLFIVSLVLLVLFFRDSLENKNTSLTNSSFKNEVTLPKKSIPESQLYGNYSLVTGEQLREIGHSNQKSYLRVCEKYNISIEMCEVIYKALQHHE
jgi:hypothetical protein